MAQSNEQITSNSPVVVPDVGWCYKNGWQQLWKYILELLLITIIFFLLSVPTWCLCRGECAVSAGAVFLWLFSLAYALLLLAPVRYGVCFAFLKAARGDRLLVKDMFHVFQNYLNAVLANLLVAFIVAVGMVLLIVPGIIFACKLVFVPYLVVERKMDAVEAVKESWRMTKGHAFTVFLIGLLAIPIFIIGLICFVVGAIASVMLIRLAFASLYHAVSTPTGTLSQEAART